MSYEFLNKTAWLVGAEIRLLFYIMSAVGLEKNL